MKKVSTEKFWKKVEQRLNAVGSDVLDGSWGLGQSGAAEVQKAGKVLGWSRGNSPAMRALLVSAPSSSFYHLTLNITQP